MKKSKNFALLIGTIIVVAIILVVAAGGYWWWENKIKTSTSKLYTEDKLRAAEYSYKFLNGIPDKFTLTNKEGAFFKGKTVTDNRLYYYDQGTFGDLNGDGIPDGVAEVTIGYGANMIEPILFVFTMMDGQLKQINYLTMNEAMKENIEYIRIVKSISISNGLLHVEYLVAAPNENYHNPSIRKYADFKLQGKELKLWQNQIDTSTWKTYSNDKYGFEIRYPQNLAISKSVGKNLGNIVGKEQDEIIMKLPIEPDSALKEKNISILINQKALEEQNASSSKCFDEWPTNPSWTQSNKTIINKNIEFAEQGLDSQCNVPDGEGYAGACYFDIYNGNFVTGRFATPVFVKRYITENKKGCFALNLTLSPVKSPFLLGFDIEKESDVFEKIVNTFKFTK